MKTESNIPLVMDAGVKPMIVENNNNDGKTTRGSALRQVIASFVANIGTVNTGMVFGFSAVVLPQLQEPDSIIPITEDEASWIGKKKICSLNFECFLCSKHVFNHNTDWLYFIWISHGPDWEETFADTNRNSSHTWLAAHHFRKQCSYDLW